ncbi:acetyltransferase [Bacillus phage PSYJ-YH]|nr:acetyltransferase [Bacillus phage PSYJ-YH]
MNHHGYIYQATNFIYTGKTKGRTDKYTEGNKHSRHYTNDNNHLRKVRSSKYRYIYFTNNKKKWLDLLKYHVLSYPKGDNGRYTLGETMKTKVINTQTKEEFYV